MKKCKITRIMARKIPHLACFLNLEHWNNDHFFSWYENINLVIICQYLFRFSNPAVYSRIYNRFPKEKKIDCKLYPCTNMCIFDNDIMCKTSSLYLCLFRSIHKSKDELQITFIWQYVYTYSIYVFMAMMLYFSIS